jgi:hypothetical protein
MRVIGLLIIAGILSLPVILLDTLVMPEITQLQNTYAHLDETAARVASQ